MTAKTMLGAAISWKNTGDTKKRGVFANRNIRKGEVLEIAPAIPLAKKNLKENGEAPDGYILEWNESKKGEEYCMPLGYIMLYNHSREPNMALESDITNYTITAKAIKAIKSGEELTWNYASEIWFEEV